MNFTEHGLFKVKIEGKILLIDAIGPFNEELIIKYKGALESCIQNLEVSKWNQIIILHKLSLFTPEAEQALIQTLNNRRARGLIACAIIFVDVEGESLIKAQMSHCYNKTDVKHQFMSSIDDAKKWLATV
ncbi:hypothetical protein [Colwellia sp. PAMC 20917]|uniref:hypothetical protein n=1 Tax=Colwellia sp. PAMC 20917 TaxID=1816218 RepID=UPI000A932D4C|nr:hypothetical protein [Colwellia sp. PAMC 20917]